MSLHVHRHHFPTAGRPQLEFQPDSFSSDIAKKILKQIKEFQEVSKKASSYRKKANSLQTKGDPKLADAIEQLQNKANFTQAIADKKWEQLKKATEREPFANPSSDDDSESVSQSSSSSLGSPSHEATQTKMIVIKRVPKTKSSNKASIPNLSNNSFSTSHLLNGLDSYPPANTRKIPKFDPSTFLPCDVKNSSTPVSDKEKGDLVALYRSKKMELSTLEKKPLRTENEERTLLQLRMLLKIQTETLLSLGISIDQL